MNQESSWLECLESGSACRITTDKAKAKSLIETAKKRIIYADNIAKQDTDMNFVFESGYASLVELFHALLALRGY